VELTYEQLFSPSNPGYDRVGEVLGTSINKENAGQERKILPSGHPWVANLSELYAATA